ncbi:hypothetical protein G7Y89_g10513 [Cudoniella acicularis]|uniref:O-methyltransferase C-terminal domain-containing protein n=1 Tax=Cudoniella acicularis TaxID=354080 RepID=A0A8H4VZ51_9HELO|nr:hypothetical protein G7Y89_g10513 [Cudoniella acicularis]
MSSDNSAPNASSVELSPAQHLQHVSRVIEAEVGNFDDETRKSALGMAKNIVKSLEKPEETVMRYAWEFGPQRMALRVGIDLRLFRMLAESDAEPLSAQELAESSNAEVLLIGFAKEADEQLYLATDLTRAMAKHPLEAALKVCHDRTTIVQMHMPEYFRKFGYKVPTDGSHGPFQWALNTEMSYFEMTQADLEKLHDFSVYMSGIRVTRKHWIDWFPVVDEILSSFGGAQDEVLLVDMGGAYGHDLEKFLGKFPEAKGHLVLQDLPKTIENVVGLSEGIHAMSHDIYTEQPVKSARVYYTHFLLHDFSDKKCREILRNLMPAMKPGYSKILLNESVLPERDCPAFFAAGDLNMMSCLAGIKRTEKQWVDLVSLVGLELVKIWKNPFSDDEEGVIEVVLKT